MPGTVLGTEGPAEKGTHVVPALWKLHSRETDSKQVSRDSSLHQGNCAEKAIHRRMNWERVEGPLRG